MNSGHNKDFRQPAVMQNMAKRNGHINNNKNHHTHHNSSNAHTVLESVGPAGKMRGTMTQLIEKYTALGKEALRDDDAVLAESCFQHAEHYRRQFQALKREAPIRAAVDTVEAPSSAAVGTMVDLMPLPPVDKKEVGSVSQASAHTVSSSLNHKDGADNQPGATLAAPSRRRGRSTAPHKTTGSPHLGQALEESSQDNFAHKAADQGSHTNGGDSIKENKPRSGRRIAPSGKNAEDGTVLLPLPPGAGPAC